MNKKRRKKMTQEDKQLLIKDLCARLPYGVIIAEFDKYDNQIRKFELKAIGDSGYLRYDAGRDGEQGAALYSQVTHGYCKPYLRHLSTMTDEEDQEYDATFYREDYGGLPSPWSATYETFDWLNAHHFDFRGLISMGLAIEAPEGMYKK